MDIPPIPVVSTASNQPARATGAPVIVTAKRPKDVQSSLRTGEIRLNSAEISFLNPADMNDLISLIALQAGVDRNQGFDGVIVNGAATRDLGVLAQYPVDAISNMSVVSGDQGSAFGFSSSERLLRVDLKANYDRTTANLTSKGAEALGEQTSLTINRARIKVVLEPNKTPVRQKSSFNLTYSDGSDPFSIAGTANGVASSRDESRYSASGEFTKQLAFADRKNRGSIRLAVNASGAKMDRESQGITAAANDPTAFQSMSETAQLGLQIETSISQEGTFNPAVGRSKTGFQSSALLTLNHQARNAQVLRAMDGQQHSDSDLTRASLQFNASKVISLSADDPRKSVFITTNSTWGETRQSNFLLSSTMERRSYQVDHDRTSSISVNVFLNNFFAPRRSFAQAAPAVTDAAGSVRRPESGISMESGVIAISPALARALQNASRFGFFRLTARLTHRADTRFDDAVNSTIALRWQMPSWGANADVTRTISAQPLFSELSTEPEIRQNGLVFDYATDQAVSTMLISGRTITTRTPQTQTDTVRVTWQPTFADRTTFNFAVNDITSTNSLISFPTLTPLVESLLPSRVLRDAAGALKSIDLRPVQLAGARATTFSVGFSSSMPFSTSQTISERLSDPSITEPQLAQQLVSKGRIILAMNYRTQLRDDLKLSKEALYFDRATLYASARDRYQSSLDTQLNITYRAYGLRLNSSLSLDNQAATLTADDTQHSWSARASLDFNQLQKLLSTYSNLGGMFLYFDVTSRPISNLAGSLDLTSTIDRYSEQSLADATFGKQVRFFTLGLRIAL